MKCSTVKIKHDDSYAVINESDFDADEHELYAGSEDGPKKGTKAWYQMQLAAKGVGFPADASKADLKALLDA